jgi:hypothetical protein
MLKEHGAKEHHLVKIQIMVHWLKLSVFRHESEERLRVQTVTFSL